MSAPDRTSSDAPAPIDWSDRNQQWLAEQFAALRAHLEARTAAAPAEIAANDTGPIIAPPHGEREFTPALDRCADLFGLSGFEREILLLVAGIELDDGLRRAVAQAQDLPDAGRSWHPTFSLALRMLSKPHWDALSPLSPLRRWRLLELEGRRAPAQQPMHVDERVLHYLTGVAAIDERLAGLTRLEPNAGMRPTSALGQRIARSLADAEDRVPLVIVAPSGSDRDSAREAALEGLDGFGAAGLWLLAGDLPADPKDLAETALLIDREAALLGAVAVIEFDTTAEDAAEHERRAIALTARLLGPMLMVGTPDPGRLAGLAHRRIVRTMAPEPAAQTLLDRVLAQAPAGSTEVLTAALRPALRQFRLPAKTLQTVVGQALLDGEADGASAVPLQHRIWLGCRENARGGLDAVAQRVDSRAGFDDIVLPLAQAEMLRDIAQQLRHRHTVYDEWGMAGKTGRDQGLCALFAGESGTGKTLAAEAIANEIGLDLYRIDLATVVSKYIGETEKNLKRLFEGAEASGAVLLFDEADALYGKRSEVKDSHDRYANIEVAYLLQRIEAYRGLAILTTNFKSALDRAFLRRIRFVVQFPFPDDAARQQIWRRELPDTAPKLEIDYPALARLQLSGGHIRSIAVNAAFIAAAAGQPITMPHLRLAARREAAKLERPLSEATPRSFA